MTEFDRDAARDPAETAYRDALLADDDGREQRRARLMAALPTSPTPVAVGGHALAWRRAPHLVGLLLAVLVLAAVLWLKGRGGEAAPPVDPRLASAEPASAPVLVAQAEPVGESPVAAATEAPAEVAKLDGGVKGVVGGRAAKAAQAASAPARTPDPDPVVLAQASPPAAVVPADASAAAEAPAAPAMGPAMAPAPAAPAVAATSPPQAVADAANAREFSARGQGLSSHLAARAKALPGGASPAASAGSAPAGGAADPMLLAAATRGDLAAARAALQAGAWPHARDGQGRTALMLAARAGARELVARLLAAGARPSDRDTRGWTAADHARERGHDDIVELIGTPR